MNDDLEPEITDAEAEQEIEIPASGFVFARTTEQMPADLARAKVIATFVANPGVLFTLEEFTDARLDKYGQSRAWGHDLLEELETGGLITLVDDDPHSMAWQVSNKTEILVRWA